ncbi:MAG: site-specific integrase [Acholeplasmataceae bacterium]|nr:site-specific integrase [Acholeplasmataceae bacterium]MCD4826560.1 site-specific integrase [Acholeplasmataceae bacterium]
MKLETMINNYLLEIKLRYANGTYRFYKSHLWHFFNYAKKYGITDTDDVDANTIVDYITHMKETNANVTINKNIGCLKRMYKQSGTSFDYLQNIQKLKERSKTFDAIEMNDYMRIRKYILEYPEVTTNGIFYKCFLALLADTGARIQEIMFIEKKNVNLETQEILLTHTKTKEDRSVFFTDKLSKDIIKKMLKVKSDHKYLLHNIDKNRQSNYDDIRYILRQVKKQLKIKKLHPHMFRHTVASHLMETGMSLINLMDILGHKNLETTKRYLHMSKKHMKKSYNDKMDTLN